MLIRLEHEGDFNRLRIKDLNFIEIFLMRIFRWFLDFRADVESPIVPIWIGLPDLPLFLFDKKILFSIGKILGSPLKIDMLTAEISRPSLAKICVEVDLTKKLPSRIWLECGDSIPGF